MKAPEAKLLKYDTIPDPDLGIHIVRRHNIRSGPVFDKHWHDYLQFILFEKGEAVMHCHQGTFPLSVGDIALINSGELHYMDRIDGSLENSPGLDFVLLKISPRFLQGRFLQPVVDLRYVFVNCIQGDAILGQTMYLVLKEYETRAAGWDVAIRAHVLAILARLMRHYVDQKLSQEESRKQQDRWLRMGKVLEYLAETSTENTPLKTLASMACQSESHFCRSFRKLTGFSSREYLLRIRIQKAETLLRRSGKSIAEVGYAVGFADNNYFSRAFRKIKGCSPREYLREKKNANGADNLS